MTDQALVITQDAELLCAVEAAAAAADAKVSATAEPAEIRRRWSHSRTVLVGTDMASLIIGMALPTRDDLHVIGSDQLQLLNWSVPLAAPAMLVPQQSGFLSSILSQAGDAEAKSATVLRVLGGHGGAGASTLAAALAQCAAQLKARSALVETDRYGGGIELLFGAEQTPGWRWNELRSAAGYVGDLSGQLPNVSGVDLVSLGNRQGVAELPDLDALRAIVGSLRRSHDLVVLDAGRAGADTFNFTAKTLLVVAADVRAVLAARARIWDNSLHDSDLLVRTGPGWRVAPEMVAETLGLPLVGVLSEERQLVLDAAIGAPPGRRRRSKITRTCRTIIDNLLSMEHS